MGLYNSAVPHPIVFPSTLALLAEKDVRASTSLPLPVTSHDFFSNSDVIALSACKSLNVRSSHACSHDSAFHCDLIGLKECE